MDNREDIYAELTEDEKETFQKLDRVVEDGRREIAKSLQSVKAKVDEKIFKQWFEYLISQYGEDFRAEFTSLLDFDMEHETYDEWLARHRATLIGEE